MVKISRQIGQIRQSDKTGPTLSHLILHRLEFGGDSHHGEILSKVVGLFLVSVVLAPEEVFVSALDVLRLDGCSGGRASALESRIIKLIAQQLVSH